MNTLQKRKIIIVEDNLDISTGFTFLINSTSNYEVIRNYISCETAIEGIANMDVKPDIILMDVDLPGMSGIEGTQIIKAKYPNIQILIITVFENSERVFEALCAGATGYLTKNTKHTKLLDALDEILEGGSPMSTNIARMVINSFAKNTFSNPLSEKETKILQKLVEGKSYKSVALETNISIDTVKFHIKNIYLKLQVNTKEDAIAKARENKWF